MKNLIKCHFQYLISRNASIIILTVLFVSLLGYASAVLAIDDRIGFKENNAQYFENAFFILKFLSVFLGIFIFGTSFLPKSDQYLFLVIPRNISKLKYFLSKSMTLALFLAVFLWLEFFLFLTVGYLGYGDFMFSVQWLFAFLKLYVVALDYGCFCLFLILCFKNIFLMLIPITFYIASSIINENPPNLVFDVFNFLVINFHSGRPDLVFGNLHALVLLSCIFSANAVKYIYSDAR